MCLQALEEQTYPKNLYEVIVIDNNSEESIEAVTAEFEQVRLGFEASPGSYAARNQGIAMARGEILAFTDSDCQPKPQWIENAVKALELENADLVGGKITFIFSPEKTAAEMYDSMVHLKIEQLVEEQKSAITANLFARKHVFDSIGLFAAHLKSGGDVTWTKAATSAGFKLIYSPDAEVAHPARKLYSLLKKLYRIGAGQSVRALGQQQALKRLLTWTILEAKPPSFGYARRCIDKWGTEDMYQKFFSIWLTIWLSRCATNLGRINSLLRGLIFSTPQN